MQSSMRLPSYSIRDQLENQFSELMRERNEIQGESRFQGKSKTNVQGRSYNGLARNYEAQRSQLSRNDLMTIQKIQKNIMAKIQEERADNRQIKARISDLQVRSEQQRRRSTLLQGELQRLTGVDYSRKNNQTRPPKFETFTPKPIQNSFNPFISPQPHISELKSQINKVSQQNQQLKKVRNPNNQGFVGDLKAKVLQAQRKAEQYRNLINVYRQKASKKDNTSPQIARLFSQAERIKIEGENLIRNKENIEKVNEKKYEEPNTKKATVQHNKSNKYFETIPQEKGDYPSQQRKYPIKQQTKLNFPTKLQVKSVISSTQEIKKQEKQIFAPAPKMEQKKPSINENVSGSTKAIESKKNVQSMLDEMMKVFSGSE